MVWHEQDMRRRLRVEIVERGDLLVLVHHARGDLLADNLAEDAVGIGGHTCTKDDRSPRSWRTSAARIGDAVSVRRILGPSVMSRAPMALARRASSGA